MDQYKRQTAVKVKVSDILTGNYVTEEGWQPNYLETDKGHVSRVNLLGVIVSKSMDTEFLNFTLDDGTGKISVRDFENKGTGFSIGDLVILVGRPRMFQNTLYVAPEIIKKCDLDWVEVRKKELGIKKGSIVVETPTMQKEPPTLVNSTPTQSAGPSTEIVKEVKSSNDVLIDLIRTLDKGTGIDSEEVIQNSKFENTEKIIEILLKNGDLFEVSPGKLKVLE